jgi:NhaP-type Na+/H+ or K+/H+ antiporter
MEFMKMLVFLWITLKCYVVYGRLSPWGKLGKLLLLLLGLLAILNLRQPDSSYPSSLQMLLFVAIIWTRSMTCTNSTVVLSGPDSWP